VLEYSQHLSGKDSLYETAATLGDLALIDRSFANAEGAPLSSATPKAGYVFNVMTAQGAGASGGARSYMSGARMTLGYALGATANQYDGTGRNTFMISNAGTILQFDQGTSGAPPTTFNPTTLWVIAE